MKPNVLMTIFPLLSIFFNHSLSLSMISDRYNVFYLIIIMCCSSTIFGAIHMCLFVCVCVGIVWKFSFSFKNKVNLLNTHSLNYNWIYWIKLNSFNSVKSKGKKCNDDQKARKVERERERMFFYLCMIIDINGEQKKKIYLNEKEKCSSNEFNKGKIKMRNTKKKWIERERVNEWEIFDMIIESNKET